MRNYVQPGDVITVTAPADVASGVLIKVGMIVGVTQYAALSGQPVEISTTGVFDLAKTSAQAWATVGLPIYFIPGSGLLTTANTSGNQFVGVNVETAANPSGTGRIRLNPAYPVAVV